jgi:outer membrane lipoprotein-sorting protein
MPSNASLRRVAVVAVLAVAVVGLGAVALWPTESEAASPPIGHNASDRLASLDGYTATVETVIRTPNGTNQTVERIWRRPGTGSYNAKKVEGDGPARIVSNGSVTWIYDREANNVTKLELDDPTTQADLQGERIERMFTRLNVTRETTDETDQATVTPSGDAPLPAVPAGQTAPTEKSPTVEAADQFGVRYEGTDTVADREVYVLSIQPESDDAALLEGYEQTLYVDTEWFLTLKTHTEYERNGGTYETTVTYRSVTFEPGIDDDRFRFDPPENATVDEPDLPERERYESLAALRDDVSLPVPDPDLPERFSFDTAVATTGNVTGASVQYSSPRASLVVGIDNRSSFNVTDGEQITIDGREGIYQSLGPTHIVAWECGGYRYSVTANGVGRETVVSIADSIECG